MALASNSCLSNFSHGILLSLRSRQWLETDQTFCLTELCLWVLPSAFDLSCQSQRGAEDSVVTCHASVRLTLLVSQFLYFCDTLRVRQGCCIFVPHVVLCWQDTIYIWPSCPLPASQGLGCAGCNPLLSLGVWFCASLMWLSILDALFHTSHYYEFKTEVSFLGAREILRLCYHPSETTEKSG